MIRNRRDFFGRIAAMGASVAAGGRALAQNKKQPPPTHEHHQHAPADPAKPGGFLPVELPDLPKLPYTLIDGVKEFHLVAEPVRTEFLPGRAVEAWGYNGSVPGPTIEAQEGDRVRVVFHNHLPEMTAIHWHGFEVPTAMDGSVGLGQDPVPPGGQFVYEFTLDQHGTFFYHSHFAMQEMMGMLGMFVLHPKTPQTPKVDRDFGILMQEWALLPNNNVPNTLAMEFNWLTFNGRSGPDCTPMIVRQGERVRIRLVNLGMDHHPIHLHGNQFMVTGTEAGRKPESQWFHENTVLVGVAQARDIEFEAKFVGDWMLHCHLPHHMMNQMMSMVGPVSHMGHGLHTGAGMQEGMGMLRQGNALAEEFGPALGRGLGVAADAERATSNLVAQAQPPSQQRPQPQHDHGQHTSGGGGMDFYPKDDPEKKKIPGYPQDMWMVVDDEFNHKPENYGLRKGWTGAMMGMMTLVRVVTPEIYAKIEELKKQAPPQQKKGGHQHHAG